MGVIEAADEILRRIRRFIGAQVERMAQLVADQASHDRLHLIAAFANREIDDITQMVQQGKTHPFQEVRLSESQPPARAAAETLRLGVYPLAANPLHWGHIFVGLSALALLELDRVAFVVAGSDPRKPFLLPEEERHRLARAIMKGFEPFFAYSPIALGTDRDGETNLGSLLALNEHVPLHAYYVAGFDHYRRLNERGEPDTIEKLERLARDLARNSAGHSLSVAFVNRPGLAPDSQSTHTFLDVRVLPPIPVTCSSTAARHALCRDSFTEAMACLPHVTLSEIRSLRLYAGERSCREESETS